VVRTNVQYFKPKEIANFSGDFPWKTIASKVQGTEERQVSYLERKGTGKAQAIKSKTGNPLFFDIAANSLPAAKWNVGIPGL